uniref:Cytochrome c oxidase subunit 5A, mitochondrial n=1 Tax=Syphacia muris TaxID=451379 RepID=A0A0N5AE02_9BILA
MLSLFRNSSNVWIRHAACWRRISTSAAICGCGMMQSGKEKWSPEKFDKHFIDFLNRPEIDGWEIRQALTELGNYDVVPEPEIVRAALLACRRVNDYALCVRFLEAVKWKCGSKRNRKLVYGYIINEPLLEQLGISTPEELGFDEPELFIPQPEWWWERSWYKEYGYDKKRGYEY